MLLQKFPVLFLKRHCPVVLALVLYVMNHCREVRFADGEATVALLPRELAQMREFFM